MGSKRFSKSKYDDIDSGSKQSKLSKIEPIIETEGVCINFGRGKNASQRKKILKSITSKLCTDGSVQTLGNGLCMVCWDRRISDVNNKEAKEATKESRFGQVGMTTGGFTKPRSRMYNLKPSDRRTYKGNYHV